LAHQAGQGHETINYTWLKTDWETLWRYHSRTLSVA